MQKIWLAVLAVLVLAACNSATELEEIDDSTEDLVKGWHNPKFIRATKIKSNVLPGVFATIVAFNPKGETFVAGWFTQGKLAGAVAPIPSLRQPPEVLRFLRKYNSSGQVSWTRIVPGFTANISSPTNDLVVAGPGNQIYIEAGYIYVYSSEGNLIKSLSPDSRGYIAVDDAGNVYHAGYGSIAKFDSNGQRLWTTPLEFTYYPIKIAFDFKGNIRRYAVMRDYDSNTFTYHDKFLISTVSPSGQLITSKDLSTVKDLSTYWIYTQAVPLPDDRTLLIAQCTVNFSTGKCDKPDELPRQANIFVLAPDNQTILNHIKLDPLITQLSNVLVKDNTLTSIAIEQDNRPLALQVGLNGQIQKRDYFISPKDAWFFGISEYKGDYVVIGSTSNRLGTQSYERGEGFVVHYNANFTR